jgi:hypothetical protein
MAATALCGFWCCFISFASPVLPAPVSGFGWAGYEASGGAGGYAVSVHASASVASPR